MWDENVCAAGPKTLSADKLTSKPSATKYFRRDDLYPNSPVERSPETELAEKRSFRLRYNLWNFTVALATI